MPLFIRMVNGVASVCAVGICVLRFALQNTEVSMHPGNMLEKSIMRERRHPVRMPPIVSLFVEWSAEEDHGAVCIDCMGNAGNCRKGAKAWNEPRFETMCFAF